jgi:hypothetical protein
MTDWSRIFGGKDDANSFSLSRREHTPIEAQSDPGFAIEYLHHAVSVMLRATFHREELRRGLSGTGGRSLGREAPGGDRLSAVGLIL